MYSDILFRVACLALVITLITLEDVSAWRRRRRRRCDSSPCSWVWNGCSQTCGGGTRTPRITRNKGACGSCNLPGAESCNTNCCPVNCVWGEWTDWGSCSAPCGGGEQIRTRSHSVEAYCGGMQCSGPTSESMSCNTQCCPVDCSFNDWTPWSGCSAPCGGGQKTRSRTLITATSCGGQECDGSTHDGEVCNTQCCQVDCAWSDWQPWGECSSSCGDGKQTRSRIIATPSSCGGQECEGVGSESISCNLGCCKIDCKWGSWQGWSGCSTTCGDGKKTRRREIETAASCGGQSCEGEAIDTGDCNVGCCPVSCEWLQWSQWTDCSKSCGRGESLRARSILTYASCGGEECNGEVVNERSCNDVCCPTDCKWEEWADWSRCSVTCGEGIQRRTRRILTPSSCGGNDCNGEADQTKICNQAKCPVTCNPAPTEHFERLPVYCNNEDGSPRYVNTGYCPRKRCGNFNEDDNNMLNCCGAIEKTIVEEDCDGSFTVPITKILTCGCHTCKDEVITVNFLVIGANKTDPLKLGLVKRNEDALGRTDEHGFFSINLSPGPQQVTFTFVDDREQRFMPTRKVIKLFGGSRKIVETVKMVAKPHITIVDSTQDAVVKLAPPPIFDVDGNIGGFEGGFLGEISIPGSSVYTSSGDLFEGEFETSIIAFDNKSPNLFDIAPGEFKTSVVEDETISTKPLKNYGMFEVFTSDSNGEELYLDKVELKFDASAITNQADLNNMHIWSFDDNSGLWDDEGQMDVFQHISDDEETERVFLIAQISIRARRLWSLNVLVEEYCYAKVRTYLSDKFDYRDQVNGVSIRALYFDEFGLPQGYSLEHSMSGQGSCVMVPCDAREDLTISKTMFTAANDNEKLNYIAAPITKMTNITGINEITIERINYRHPEERLHFNISHVNNFFVTEFHRGPFYHYSQIEECLSAPYQDQHFRFYKEHVKKQKDIIYEFNSISTEPFEPNVRNWWPKESNNFICFIKVKVIGGVGTLIQASSAGGSREDMGGKLYGFRQNLTIGDNESSGTCLEFKCSDTLSDGVAERPLVIIKAMKSTCTLSKVNMFLDFYNKASKRVAQNTNGNEYKMFAPSGTIGSEFGIFMAQGINSRDTVRETFNRCMAGGKFHEVGDDIDVDKGSGITFDCYEK